MSSDTTNMFEIIVAGTGPAGLFSALALSAAGFRVALVGPEFNQADARTTALMVPALQFLDDLALLDEVSSAAAPLNVMRIVDGTTRLVRSPTVTFHASEIGEPHFGLNVPNRHLNAMLAGKIAKEPGIVWTRAVVDSWTIDDDRIVAHVGDARVSAKLAVAADGRTSPARAAAGIETSETLHAQSALALTFGHTRSHAFVSTEFHTETGPFTQVPLPGDRSSLVWVVRPEEAAELAVLPLAALSGRVEARMQSMLGKVTVDAPPQIYPLAASLPKAFARNRVALVGESAHIFPPIGAQGLNLGIRDIRQLVSTCEDNRDDPGSPTALRSYDRSRRPDILARSAAVDLLGRSLLSDMLPTQLARSAGLNMLGAFAPLRAFLMREGLRPGSGFGTIFSSRRKQVRQ